MADLKRIFVLHTTSDQGDGNTNAGFELIVARPGGDLFMPFPDLPHDERERGRTDEYMFDVSNQSPRITTDSELKIRMTSTNDGWLPKTMWAIGETMSGNFEVLAGHPAWGPRWFDRGSNPAGPDSHRISNQS